MSLLLQFESSNATPVWPSAGFAFAMVLLWGNRIAPGILFGAFAANFMIFITNQTVDYPTAAGLSLIISIGNMAEALLGNFLLKRTIPEYSVDRFFTKVSHVFLFSLTAGTMCFVSSLVGSTTVYVADIIPHNQFPIVWITWWLGDFSGILLVTSFILIWYAHIRNQFKLFENKKVWELIFLSISVVVVSGIIFSNWIFPHSLLNYSYWLIPIFAWGALRFEKHVTISAIAVCSVIAVIGTIHLQGMFGDLPLNDALISLQAFISIMVVTNLSLTISNIERKKTQEILLDAGRSLEARVKIRTEQLVERNQFADTILNSSSDSIIVLDTETRCISINRMAKSQLYLPYPGNVVGKKILELPHSILSAELRGDITRALAGENVRREKLASPISERYYQVDYIPLFNEASVYAIMIVAHDITQRIHAEHELREQKLFAEMLIENSPNLIMAYDKNFKITAWNRKSEEHSGYPKAEALGKNMFDLFPHYNNEKWLSTMHKILVEGKSLHIPKIEFHKSPGWGECFVTPLYNSYNEITGVLSITHEITELVNMASILEERNRDLQTTNEELSSFAYVASHDLQEPLRKIQIFSKRITDSEMNALSETGRDYFIRMKNAAQRMQLLIEDVLMYSRTGSLARKFEKIHLSQVIDEVKSDLKDEILAKNARITDENLCECSVIPFQIRQLFHNLFVNSLKFTSPERNPHIIVTSTIATGEKLDHSALDKEKEYCHIVISDNGIGFEPNFNQQIFGLFQRLHGKNEYPGTGIGLAICKKIIDNHYGIIVAHGEPGKGATFNIYLPHKDE